MERGRFTARLQLYLAEIGRRREERRIAHEQGEDHPLPPEIEEGLVGGYYPEGEDQEIVLFDPNIRECLDTRWFDEVARHNEIYNQSVSTEEDPRLKDD